MVKSGLYVSLDIGTTSVKVVVAEYIENQMNIIGVGNARSEGINRGIIVDIEQTARSIQRAVKQAEEKSGVQINKVSVGIPSNQLEMTRCEGMIAVNTDSKEITDNDVYNVATAAIVRATPPERQIITVIPQEFRVDGFEGIKDPRGMIGIRLEMTGVVFTGPRTIIHNIQKCVQSAGLQIGELVITSLALSNSILSEAEKDFGTIVIDMGGGQTTTSITYEQDLKLTRVEAEGGEFVSKDISVVLNTSLRNAEVLKLNYGDAFPRNVSKDERVPVDVIGQEELVHVPTQYISEIIEARVEQIFKKIKQDLRKVDALDIPGGIVITGGAASMPGIVELANEIFETNVKLYVPSMMGLRNPVFSNSISILNYTVNLNDIYQIAKTAVNGERYEEPRISKASERQPQERQFIQEEVQDEPYEQANTYHQNDEVVPEKKKGSGRVKNFISSIFD